MNPLSLISNIGTIKKGVDLYKNVLKKNTKTQTPIYPTPTGAPLSQSVSSPAKSVSTSVSTPTVNQSATSPQKENFINTVMKGSTQQPTYTQPTYTRPTYTPPTTPTIDTSGRDTAFKNYLATLSPTTSESEAKRKYLDFITSAESGIAGLEGQGRGIPLSLVRGKQAKLGEQANITAKRLQGDIDLAQQERQAQQEQAKAKYDFEQGLLKENTPVQQEGFTLGKDQVRYDAQGNIIAGGQSTPTTQIGYTEGANPTVDSYVKAIRDNQIKISDVPDEYKNSVVQGLTAKESKLSDSAKNTLSIVDALLANPSIGKISGTVDQFLGGLVGDQAKLAKNYYNQLKGILSLENRQLLKGSGAISDFEFKVLGQAATALGRNLDDATFKNELQKLKDKLTGNSPIPTTPTDGDVWKSPDGTEYEFSKGKWNETGSFNSVGNTTASNIPQRNNNPGNIKSGGLADSLATGVDNQGHLIFPDSQTGLQALRMELEAKIGGKSKYLPENPTLAQLGKVYAEDQNWSKNVAKILGVSPMTNTKSIPIDKLVQAVARQEGFYA